MGKLPPHTIVSSIRTGDKNSFRELFNDYFPVLCVFAGKYLKDEELCKDVSQETLLTYWEKRESFNDIYKVKSFLYTVARNRCLNLIKKERTNQDYHLRNRSEEAVFFEENILEQETYLLVQKAIESLPQQMRTIIRHAMEGLKNPQIAEIMGIAEGTVHSLKKTAYRKLRQELKEHFYLLLFF